MEKLREQTGGLNNRYWVQYGGSGRKESAFNAGDPGLILESGRSPGDGNGYPLYYSYLENPVDPEAWQATVHRVTELDTTEVI